MNVSLVGLRGVGKTTLLTKETGLPSEYGTETIDIFEASITVRLRPVPSDDAAIFCFDDRKETIQYALHMALNYNKPYVLLRLKMDRQSRYTPRHADYYVNLTAATIELIKIVLKQVPPLELIVSLKLPKQLYNCLPPFMQINLKALP